jgi:hypothetical protein
MNLSFRRSSPVIAALATLLFAGAALAGSIDFTFSGTGSTSQASWHGGSSSVKASASQVALASPTNPFTLGDATISFTSGPGNGGSGTESSPYTFGASSAGSITITGCLPGQGSGCSPVTLFSGQFTSGADAFWSDGEGHFESMSIAGTINSALASDLGFQSDTFAGDLDAVIRCSALSADACTPGMSRMLSSGSLVLQGGSLPSVPEPSTLFLLGSGLAAASFALRLRSRKSN